jgi:hypothetical protein
MEGVSRTCETKILDIIHFEHNLNDSLGEPRCQLEGSIHLHMVSLYLSGGIFCLQTYVQLLPLIQNNQQPNDYYIILQ